MKIGITGSHGLIGKHLQAYILTQPSTNAILADKSTFASPQSLQDFVKKSEVIVHLASINRAPDQELYEANITITQALIKAMKAVRWKGVVVFSNSTHISRDTAYGKAKKECAKLLSEWAEQNQSGFCDLVLPHVFGEFGKPFYNSVVSTFCHQLANNDVPKIDVDGSLNLLHAGEASRIIIENLIAVTANKNSQLQIRPEGTALKVSSLLKMLSEMIQSYEAGIIPELNTGLELQLFNTLRSYIFAKKPYTPAKVNKDARGYLFEAIKTKGPGQTFFSTTKPGIVRGNHFHRRKIERFCVVKGEAEIKLRALHSKEIITVKCNGNEPIYVDIPTLHTHNITNIGKSELLTMFWSNEIFDPNDSDTYPQAVENE